MSSDEVNKLRGAFNKRKALDKGPPEVEFITHSEVYLLDEEGDRVRRICGSPRRGLPKGYVCTNPAGKGTNHPGYAQCKKHDTTIPNANNTGLWNTLNQDAGLPSTLSEYLENAQRIEDEHITTVDEDIRALYALFTYQLSKKQKFYAKDADGNDNPAAIEGEIPLSNADIELALKIQDKILKAKEVRLKLSKELVLDTSTIKHFVQQIFKVATEKLPERQAKLLLKAFLEEVIVPFQTQGRIVGSDFQYSPESGDLMGDISDG